MSNVIDLNKYKREVIDNDAELKKLERFHLILEKVCPEVDKLCEAVENTLTAKKFVEKKFFDAVKPAVLLLNEKIDLLALMTLELPEWYEENVEDVDEILAHEAKRVGTLRCFAKRITETHQNPIRPSKKD